MKLISRQKNKSFTGALACWINESGALRPVFMLKRMVLFPLIKFIVSCAFYR